MKRLAVALLCAGCSSTDGGAPPDLAAGSGDMAVQQVVDLGFNPYADLAGADFSVPPNADLSSSVPPDLATQDLAQGGTITVSIGPIALNPGDEKTVCQIMPLPNTGPIDVTRIDATLAPGSHHLIIYKSTANQATPIYNCGALDTSMGDVPLYIAETQMNNALPLPTGVAYQLPAAQMVRLEAHYLNASNQMVNGMGTITLTVGAQGNYQPADIMFCGSFTPLAQGLGKGVPPGMTTLPAGFYKPPAGVKVFGLTTHEHKRGTLMTVDKSTSTAPGTNLIMGQPYDNPPFNVYGDANLISFAANEGFRWQCNYNNTGNMTYYFGQSAENNEMCFFWAYYFPSAGRFLSQADCWR